MSIQKIGKRQYIGVCDVCASKTPIYATAQDVVAHMRREEWSTHKERPGDWVNICDDCKEAIYE